MRTAWAAAFACFAMLACAPAADGSDRAALDRYAKATWASFDAMTDPGSGLPTDACRSLRPLR